MNVQFTTHSIGDVHRLIKQPQLPQHGGLPEGVVAQGACVPEYTKENEIIMKSEPAKISFSGYSFGSDFRSRESQENIAKQLIKTCDGYNLAVRNIDLDTLISNAEKIVNPDGKIKKQSNINKKVLKFIDEVISFVTEGKKDSDSQIVRNFAQDKENKSAIASVKKDLDELLKERKNSSKDLRRSIVQDATKIIQTAQHPSKWLKSKNVFKFFGKAADNQIIFSVLYALILTGVMRPASIMALPGQKKNKDDKKYAAAHSIASGVIGYLVSSVISNPIASALKKVGKYPDKNLNMEKASYLYDDEKKIEIFVHSKKRKFFRVKNTRTSYIYNAGRNLRSSGAFNRAKKIINMGPEFVVGIPKAILTIALIPLILKYVFHLEKKPHNSANNNTQVISSKKTPKVFANFRGDMK